MGVISFTPEAVRDGERLREALRELLRTTESADFTDQRGEREFNAAADFARQVLGEQC